jgi:hypothetical protein
MPIKTQIQHTNIVRDVQFTGAVVVKTLRLLSHELFVPSKVQPRTITIFSKHHSLHFGEPMSPFHTTSANPSPSPQLSTPRHATPRHATHVCTEPLLSRLLDASVCPISECPSPPTLALTIQDALMASI